MINIMDAISYKKKLYTYSIVKLVKYGKDSLLKVNKLRDRSL